VTATARTDELAALDPGGAGPGEAADVDAGTGSGGGEAAAERFRFRLPDVGEGLEEAEVVSWKVSVGQVVQVNDVLVEIETAKSLVELPSPVAGTVAELLVEEGTTVEVGAPIIGIDLEAPAGAEPAGPGRSAEPGRPAGPGRPATPVSTSSGGDGTSAPARTDSADLDHSTGADHSADPDHSAGLDHADDADDADDSDEPDDDAPREMIVGFVPKASTWANRRRHLHARVAGSAPSSPVVLSTPPVRKLARDLGVDLGQVRPTGPRETVTRADVQRAADADVVELPESDTRRTVRETRVQVRSVRRMTAENVTASAFTAPHVTEFVEIDVTRSMKLLDRLRARRDMEGLKVSPVLLLAKAMCLAAKRTPEINATWDGPNNEIVYKHYVNLGIAAATPRGLMVPNIKDADQLAIPALCRALNELVATARAGRTTPAQMQGGSITLTNVGVFGVDTGTPILNQGESAILAFGAINDRPWVHKGRVRPRKVTTLALSFDHRIVDGEQGSRFLADVGVIMSDPATSLLWT